MWCVNRGRGNELSVCGVNAGEGEGEEKGLVCCHVNGGNGKEECV